MTKPYKPKDKQKDKPKKPFNLSSISDFKKIIHFLKNINYFTYFDEFITYLKSDDPLIASIKLNYIFYISIFIGVCAITATTNTNVIWGFISVVFISFLGYVVHYISHTVRVEELYDKIDNKNYLTKNVYINYIIRLWCKTIDFHDITHHDSKVNKTFKNVAIEFALNFYTQAGAFLLFAFFVRNLNTYVILLWGLMYPTVHLINYEFKKSKTHIFHHKDPKTNYGIDIWDILFNTKYNGDNSKIENINHYSINVCIITIIMIYACKKMNLLQQKISVGDLF